MNGAPSRLLDFVIGEAKSGSTTLNKVWKPEKPDGEMIDRLKYLVRWMGPLPSEDAINTVAGDLRKKRCARWKTLPISPDPVLR